MNKKEIKASVKSLLAAGTAKSDVFAQLSGQGVKDPQLAYWIAAQADPQRCKAHQGKVNLLVAIMLVEALVAFAVGFAAASAVGPNARWFVGILSAAVPLLLAFGYYRPWAAAYNIHILLAVVQLPKELVDLAVSPTASLVTFCINLAGLVYVWYVRRQLFPDFAFVTPRKIKGEYVFAR